MLETTSQAVKLENDSFVATLKDYICSMAL